MKNSNTYLTGDKRGKITGHTNNQNGYISLDAVYDEWEEPEDPRRMEDDFDKRELQAILRPIIGSLDERRRYVIESLYGFNGRKIKSKAAIGRALGISRQKVQSLHISVIRGIRENKDLLERLRPFW
ncbi:MAG: hypothetical protein ACMUIP_16660 [bacterium]